jgi:hypothetical protein
VTAAGSFPPGRSDEDRDDVRCPVCGEGTLQDIAFDEGSPPQPLKQQADSREVQTFTCGHTVEGASLAQADADGLDVERRHSDETVDPAAG